MFFYVSIKFRLTVLELTFYYAFEYIVFGKNSTITEIAVFSDGLSILCEILQTHFESS